MRVSRWQRILPTSVPQLTAASVRTTASHLPPASPIPVDLKRGIDLAVSATVASEELQEAIVRSAPRGELMTSIEFTN